MNATPARTVASNSRLGFRNETPPRVVESGFDTWRLCRYLGDRDLDRCRDALPNGVAGGFVTGHRVGVLPGHRMLWLEGHPAVDGLASPASLPEAQERVLDELRAAGLPAGTDAGIGRLDSTVTLRFPDGRAGQAVLCGLAAVDAARTKPGTEGRPPETVYWRAERSRKVLMRAYDKGLEANLAPRGELIRLEAQSRFAKSARMRAAVHAEIGGAMFKARFTPVAESCDGLTAATFPVVADRVAQLVDEGEITTRQAERMVGYLALSDRARRYSKPTRWRRRRELRAWGLVMVDPMADPVSVDLGEPLRAALEAWDVEARA